jgi:hypothetical protein
MLSHLLLNLPETIVLAVLLATKSVYVLYPEFKPIQLKLSATAELTQLKPLFATKLTLSLDWLWPGCIARC